MTPTKTVAILLAGLIGPTVLAQKAVNLNPLFDTDVFLETGGTGLGNALDTAGRRIDAATLPANYVEGSFVTNVNGQATYKFGALQTESLDAVRVNGQRISVESGHYSSVDLALLSAPGSFLNPFTDLEFIYTDGTNSNRLGPVPGWFGTPNVFNNAIFRYSDQGAVTEYVSFPTNGDADEPYLVQSANNAISGGWRFADGTGYFLYKLDVANIHSGKLGITIGNNFVVSVATEYLDPSVSKTEGYTVLANSKQIYGVDHHSLGNLKEYELDVTSQLAVGTGELYILLTDGSEADGWGPYVQRIRMFEGTPLNFEERLQPVVDTSKATVYANFQIASAEEGPFLFENNGSGPSSRGHRFADGSGNLTYRFNLPDNVTNAKLTVDMENNFVVALAGPAAGASFAKVTPNTSAEAAFLVDAGNSATQPNARFADGSAYMIYEFNLPDNVTTAFARVQVGNTFVVEGATGVDGEYTILRDDFVETGVDTHDLSNLAVYTFDLAPFLANNPSKVVRLRLTDGVTSDGWGPYLRGIEIVESPTAGAPVFTEVLNSQNMFGEDIKNESNRKLYTIDLAQVLTNNNPGREVYVRFTDGSTSDGWGPSLYWMSVYTGEISSHADSLIFPNLKTTLGDPANLPVNLLSRNYPLDPSRTLIGINLPVHPTNQTSSVYLLAATLNLAPVLNLPSLQIARVDANRIRISWPAADGFILQSTSSFTSPVQWVNSQAPVQTNGGIMSVEISTTSSQSFFRLKK